MFQRIASVRLHPVHLTWIAAAYFATIGNIPLWQTLCSHVEVDSLRSLLFLMSLPVFLFCLINLLLTPFMLVPYVRKPLLAMLVLISAGCSYFMLSYNVLIDRSMVQNFFETNQAEMASYFSMPLLLSIFALGVVPATLMLLPQRPRTERFGKTVWRWAAHILVTCILLTGVTVTFYKDYASLIRNNLIVKDQMLPFNFVRNTNGYLKRKASAKIQPLRRVAEDAVRPEASTHTRPKLVILVIGETARAQNFQLNGYSRPTNPTLTLRTDIVNFHNVASCGTATAISVPCMFSRMTRAQYDEVRAATEENLLDILQRTGVHILWRNNNNGGCKKQCDRVAFEDMPKLQVPTLCVNPDGTCYDDVLLHRLSERVESIEGDALIVLHQIGSHGPTYFERYPKEAKTFSPTCNSNQIHKCSQEALINTYDNSLIYTDQMLSKTIEFLQRYSADRDVGMIYLSDHGESLGERGMYLHGTPYLIAPKEQTQVPMLMWLSPTLLSNARLNSGCLKSHAEDKAYSHDNLYHSMLGLFEVTTHVYDSRLDWFAECRA
ncbi:phosphoethanolamine--lipid A transferase [Lampropedia puyangensis]|uniref:Phosphoethanolamine--lipid A transferase n=1 Tax=Lampropedia puyangensis TaxID=1330072 RepID=A0A4S8FDI9_9BURK|nr:phosphoethanolamine--lipid A transferase [Lampropedia puyangensis]THU03982.1 phosphoethanolamine--lipid A transferase [Lampropedia puyangensis]